MTPFVQRALSQAGLLPILDARAAGEPGHLREFQSRAQTADWLLLGALADEIRSREVGRDVLVFANAPLPADPRAVDLTGTAADGGIAFLRDTALTRIFSEPCARIRVGWDGLGMEFAQVALAFGASELFGDVRFKDGELVTVDALLGHGKRSNMAPAQLVKRREIARFLSRAGRTALFANADGTFAQYTDDANPADALA